MKGFIALPALAGLLLAAGAQAQRAAPADAPQLEPQASRQSPFTDSFRPTPRTYGGNVAANPNDRLIEGYRTDPRLVAGFALHPNVAVEAGAAELRDRGFHYADPGRPDEVAGAFGTRGVAGHVAGKLSVPLGERIEAYGKLGVAHSRLNQRGGSETDTGLFVGAGAKLKLGEKADISGEVARYGDTDRKWNTATNASGANARLRLGF